MVSSMFIVTTFDKTDPTREKEAVNTLGQMAHNTRGQPTGPNVRS